MPFLSISLKNFRNLSDATINLSSPEVYFVGENGQGKSNLLESLYMVSYGSSFRTKTDNEVIKENEENYGVRAVFKDSDERINSVIVTYDKKKKYIEKNGKILTDRKELISSIPCVVFSHDDLSFAVGNPERRRWFIDQSISMYDIMYIDNLRKYKHILKNRNILLKNKYIDMLDIYDLKLAEAGIDIIKKRQSTIDNFNKIFTDLYMQVTGIENVQISYVPSWKNYTLEEIIEFLKKKRENDIIMGTSLLGPHRDNIQFIKNEKIFINYASTGQQRLLSILLRISQASLYTINTQRLPVLLMDDVLLELDPYKRQKLTTLLPPYDQLFCTFLPEEPYERYKKSMTRIYYVDKGFWNE